VINSDLAADENRAAASQETLANRKEMHERSTILWDEMAERTEKFDELCGRMAKAKARHEKVGRAGSRHRAGGNGRRP
jgi:hypothetical protein